MIRIRWETDYGLILLGYLVQNVDGGVRTAREIAAWAHLPLPMVSKILKSLAREGILVSHRGVKGGYTLGHRPDEISLAEVIQALEGPIGITECASHPGHCEKEGGCPMRPNWVRISQAFRESLEKIPLSEMYAPPPPPLIRLGDAGRRVQ
jgi:FeS assembly SUF system regulator